MQDKLSTYITIGLNTDTTSYNVYQYGALYTEVLYKNVYTGEFSSKARTDYNANGMVLGARYYAPLGTLQTQTNYGYDAGGHLLNIVQVASGNTVEEIYFNDPVYGIPNRTETYRNGRLQFTKTFYYH